MFKITPIQDERLAEEYLALCNIKRIPDAFVYSMIDEESGALMGISQFELFGEYGYIYDLVPTESFKDDFEAMFILGRQTMNFIDTCGLSLCKASLTSADKQLICAIGFAQNGDDYICNMQGMFDGSRCSGGH